LENSDLAPPPPAGASTTTPAPAKPAAAPVTQTQQPETAPAASATSATTPPSTTASTAPSTTTTTVGDVKFQGGAVKDAETLKAEFEKRKNRAARFGIPLKEQDKAVERAARFGVPVTAAATASLAKATGTATSSTPSTTPAAGAKTLPTKPGSIAAGVRIASPPVWERWTHSQLQAKAKRAGHLTLFVIFVFRFLLMFLANARSALE